MVECKLFRPLQAVAKRAHARQDRQHDHFNQSFSRSCVCPNETRMHIAGGVEPIQGGYTITQPAAQPHILGIVSSNGSSNGTVVAPKVITIRDNFDKTTLNTPVQLSDKISAKLQDGRIIATIELTNDQADSNQVTYSFQRDRNLPASAKDVPVNFKGIEQHHQYDKELKLDESTKDGKNFLDVEVMDNALKEVTVKIGSETFRISREEIKSRSAGDNSPRPAPAPSPSDRNPSLPQANGGNTSNPSNQSILVPSSPPSLPSLLSPPPSAGETKKSEQTAPSSSPPSINLDIPEISQPQELKTPSEQDNTPEVPQPIIPPSPRENAPLTPNADNVPSSKLVAFSDEVVIEKISPSQYTPNQMREIINDSSISRATINHLHNNSDGQRLISNLRDFINGNQKNVKQSFIKDISPEKLCFTLFSSEVTKKDYRELIDKLLGDLIDEERLKIVKFSLNKIRSDIQSGKLRLSDLNRDTVIAEMKKTAKNTGFTQDQDLMTAAKLYWSTLREESRSLVGDKINYPLSSADFFQRSATPKESKTQYLASPGRRH
jgi:hypothetical protein